MLLMYISLLEDIDDRLEFTKLYNQYNKRVIYIAYEILKRKELAEEAAQEVWARIAKNYHRRSEIAEEKIGAYIATMAKNMSLNTKKKEQGTVSFGDEWHDDIKYSYHDEWSADYNKLVELIQNLPDKYSQVLEMKFVFEMKNKEIARILKLKSSTVDTRIARGREVLIEKIREEYADD